MNGIMPVLSTVGIGLISIALMAIGWELAHKRNPLDLNREEDTHVRHDDLA